MIAPSRMTMSSQQYRKFYFLGLIAFMLSTSLNSAAHESDKHSASATYLANEGVMISSGDTKVLFDPFFHNDYGTYQLVPETILAAIKQNKAPYNNIDMVFISHAHGDHFAAQDMLDYMLAYPDVKLIAPQQAVDEMKKLDSFESQEAELNARITAINLNYKDKPLSFKVDKVNVDAVRIPHAGWPGRADVSNIVFRVTLPTTLPVKATLTSPITDEALFKENASSTYIHMGDADPNDSHFRPLSAYWQAQETDIAFPPYWFFLSREGNYILDYRINAKRSIGVHVPLKIPAQLIQTQKPYFSVPGETVSVIPATAPNLPENSKD